MKLTIRKGDLSDHTSLRKLRLEAAIKNAQEQGLQLAKSAKDYFKKHTEQILGSASAHVIVAYREHELVGYIIGGVKPAHPVYDQGMIGWMEEIFVHPEYRCKGLGKQLVQYMEQWLKEQEISSFEVNADKTKAFWQKLGYGAKITRMGKLC